MLQRLNRSSISARRTSSSTASAPLLRTYAHTATTSCTAPLVMMRLGASGSRTTTLMRLRAKSYGISSSLATPVIIQPHTRPKAGAAAAGGGAGPGGGGAGGEGARAAAAGAAPS